VSDDNNNSMKSPAGRAAPPAGLVRPISILVIATKMMQVLYCAEARSRMRNRRRNWNEVS
jgi:hypothetical protein